MNYKELFQRIFILVSSPAKAWEEISLERDRRAVMAKFVYPLIAFCGLAVFVGTLAGLGMQSKALQRAMTSCCAVFVALFGGYFLISYLTNVYGMKILKRPSQTGLCRQFIGYAMTVTFILEFITGLLPGFQILKLILQFYTVYIVWEGARSLMRIPERSLLPYAAAVSLFIIVLPALIQWAFKHLSFLLQ